MFQVSCISFKVTHGRSSGPFFATRGGKGGKKRGKKKKEEGEEKREKRGKFKTRQLNFGNSKDPIWIL